MIEPTQEDIGRKVIYTGNYGGPLEEGVITSFNDAAVFVRYGAKCHSEATNRSDLEWMASNRKDWAESMEFFLECWEKDEKPASAKED